jgi:hypothetical protein
MALTLPYKFNTAKTGIMLFKGMLGFECLMMLGILKAVFFTHSIVDTVAFGFVAALLYFLGLVIFRNMGGNVGTLTASEVVLEPVSVLGISANTFTGRFALSQFNAIRVEIVAASVTDSGTRVEAHERIYLAGANVPDILIARTEEKAGIGFAQELAALLKLPVEEKNTAR